MRNCIEEITQSNAYQNWEHSQLEPEEHLFLYRSRAPKVPKDPPGWMTRGPWKEQEDDWQEKEKRGDEFLRKHGIE